MSPTDSLISLALALSPLDALLGLAVVALVLLWGVVLWCGWRVERANRRGRRRRHRSF